jgi:hypothetical protein
MREIELIVFHCTQQGKLVTQQGLHNISAIVVATMESQELV